MWTAKPLFNESMVLIVSVDIGNYVDSRKPLFSALMLLIVSVDIAIFSLWDPWLLIKLLNSNSRKKQQFSCSTNVST